MPAIRLGIQVSTLMSIIHTVDSLSTLYSKIIADLHSPVIFKPIGHRYQLRPQTIYACLFMSELLICISIRNLIDFPTISSVSQIDLGPFPQFGLQIPTSKFYPFLKVLNKSKQPQKPTFLHQNLICFKLQGDRFPCFSYVNFLYSKVITGQYTRNMIY